MATQQHINELKKFAETYNTWILLRDDLGRKPIMLFKHKPGSWNITQDQVGLGDPESSEIPYVFWALNQVAQWEVESPSERTMRIKGSITWLAQSFETEEEIDAKISQLKAL